MNITASIIIRPVDRSEGGLRAGEFFIRPMDGLAVSNACSRLENKNEE